MKRFLASRSIKNRLTLWFFGVALVPLAVVSAVTYQQRATSVREEAFSKLTTIRDLKIAQINNWLDERISDMHTTSEDLEVMEVTETIGGGNSFPGSKKI